MEDLIWWDMSKFLTSEGDSPHSPSVGYILQDEENLEMDLTVFQNILPIVLLKTLHLQQLTYLYEIIRCKIISFSKQLHSNNV